MAVRVLLVDATNNFLRNYAVVPSLDKHGNRNGGVYGLLTTLSFFCKICSPDRMILCWDGSGGSKKRHKLFEGYKDGRKGVKPVRINKNFEFEEQDLEENKKQQRVRLAQYLKDLPVTEIAIRDIEADDVIGYLNTYFSDEQVIIASDDKDFYQLLDDSTVIFRPTKKEFYTKKSLIEEFSIPPQNFALAKAIVGDRSDNIDGIKGVGFKTLLKYFPFMSEPKEVTMAALLEFCRERVDEKSGKKYKKFLDSEGIIRRNLAVVQLHDPLISCSSINIITDQVERPIGCNLTAFRSKLLSDGIVNVGNPFFQQFRTLHMKGKATHGTGEV